ncbi:FGGY-family carbohydrate kinase [Vagococcus elongatus]|uniref:ATP:glycerol 3-phosphotransferase n=1 Tax=Vagococcus elongatus TaxID=180344 RepID=A0A430AT77_9ENTE|nr:FGGY family carbohydrate kinase [Vagococcus elongatus]RSU11258.1 glycerol kinase [Vagococcus elongatus]
MKDKGTYRIVIDQSTSGSKLLLVLKGKIVKRYDKKHRQIFPQVGWVEHDPTEIMENIYSLFEEMLADNRLAPNEIKSISITNQRETIVAWDKKTGEPVYNAIVWQCNRSREICETLIKDGFEKQINDKTGLRIDPYFSGTKIKWLYNEIPEIKEKSQQKRLAVGTIDSWIVWNLTKGQVFATEPSNACRTLLYNISTNCWDEELMTLFGINRTDLPEIKNSSETFGFYENIPIRGIMADSQAALFGQNCTKTGDVKVTMGTGCSIMMQLEQDNHFRDSRILTTVARRDNKQNYYALEGIIRSCGDSINWLNENITHFENRESVCNQVLENKSEEEVYFIPALQGLGSPYWDNEVPGGFIGVRRTTTKYDLLCSILESIVFQVKAVLNVMEEVSGIAIAKVKVDGGVTKNLKLMEEMATLLNKCIFVNDIEELSAMGALIISGETKETIDWYYQVVNPSTENQEIIQKYEKWEKLVNCFLNIDI